MLIGLFRVKFIWRDRPIAIQLLYRPVLHYVHYIGFVTRDDAYDIIIIHAYTAATHGAIIIVSSC